MSATAAAIIKEHSLVVFSKTYCGFCTKAKAELNKVGAQYHLVELDKMGGGDALQSQIQKLSGIRTVPQVFLEGEFVGDSSEIRQKLSKGDFVQQLSEKGLIKTD